MRRRVASTVRSAVLRWRATSTLHRLSQLQQCTRASSTLAASHRSERTTLLPHSLGSAVCRSKFLSEQQEIVLRDHFEQPLTCGAHVLMFTTCQR